MDLSTLEHLHSDYNHAGTRLAEELSRQFPIDSRVLVLWGKGVMEARVCFHPHLAWPTQLGVRHLKSGKVHWVCYTDLR